MSKVLFSLFIVLFFFGCSKEQKQENKELSIEELAIACDNNDSAACKKFNEMDKF